MDATHYLDAVATSRSLLPLVGRVPDTPWDPSLRDVMAETAVSVHEEEIRTRLLDELLG